VASVAPIAVPTLSAWALVLLAGLMLAGLSPRSRRR